MIDAAFREKPDPPTLESLWDFGDPVASEERFRAAIEAWPHAEHAEYRAVLITQIARALGLQQRFEEAAAELDALRPVTTDPRTAEVRVRQQLERGRLLNSSGRPAESVPHFTSALDEARRAGLEFLAVDAAHMLAIVSTGEVALEWNRTAMKLAEAATDERARRWRGALWNNIGWALHEMHRHQDALDAFEQHLAIRREESNTVQIGIARWSIARSLRALGRVDEALSLQQELLLDPERTGQAGEGYTREEIGECLLELGRADEAAAHFARAWELLHEDSWLRRDEPKRLERLRTLGDVSAT